MLIIRKAASTTQYIKDDKWHRLEDAAVIWNDGTKEYWVNGKRHRIEGFDITYIPKYLAIENEYWINGKLLTKEKYEMLFKIMTLKDGILI